MNILVDLRKLSSKPSGIGIYTYEFVKSTIKQSNDITFVGVSDVLVSSEIKELKKLGVNIYLYGKEVNKNIEVFKYSSFIQEKINELKPDIFWQPNNIMPKRIKNPYGKVMTTIHDIFPLTAKENYSFIYKKYFKHSLKNTIKSSDALIFVSDFTKNEVLSTFKSASIKKNYISYNIADFSDTADFNNDCGYFLFIGNVERRKGVDLLIQAFNVYKAKGGANKLYIAGGIRDSFIKELMERSPYYNESIQYKGYVNSSQKVELIKNCSAFVFPSRAEGFGIPPLEAIAFNKDCILSDIPVFKEVFLSSVNYFSMDKKEHKSVENLKNALFNYENIQNKQDILKLYSKKNLTERFLEFLRSV